MKAKESIRLTSTYTNSDDNNVLINETVSLQFCEKLIIITAEEYPCCMCSSIN